MSVPNWVRDAVFYQIFPDRFANGDPSNDPANVKPWGSTPTVKGFQGGDLAGITQKMDYLVDLGITGIYLNPIFAAASTHRYDTIDYMRIDPKLGSLADFHQLVHTAHLKGIRVILDGVFNHCSRGFFAFVDILENEAASPYLDWFHVQRFPLRAYEPGHARNYKAWWGIKSLPKFNTAYPPVRRYLLDVARYWIEQGADGWRLDVPNEIDDDPFWAEFREVVCEANPEAYLLGEIWECVPRWCNESHFDGLMNYPMRAAVLQYLTGTIPASHFARQVETLLSAYAPDNIHAMFNLLGSHDTERVLTYYGGDLKKVKLATLFQFAYPGTPSIYYGDEIGMKGGKDPDCRGAFPWDTAQWQTGLRDWMKQLISTRGDYPALRTGEYRRLLADDATNVYAFARGRGDGQVIVIMNASGTPLQAKVPADGLANGRELHGLLDRRQVTVENDIIRLNLEPYSGVYLI